MPELAEPADTIAPLARGDATGVMMPATPAALVHDAATFLTRAMQAYGTLPPTGRVVRVNHFSEFAGGNSGRKAQFDVVYAGDAGDLPTRLFAKFSRDFEDPFRDRRRSEIEGDIRLAALSRHPAFPVAVPRALFGDYEAQSGTGLLITERVAFGTGPIEPLHPKCMDHLLDDPREYYATLLSAQARLAAACQAGRLSPLVDELFPYDRIAAEADLPIGYDNAALADKVTRWCDFIDAHPQLFPTALRSAQWRPRFQQEAAAILASQASVRRFLQADPRFVALAHWNANIDNAWFWREPGGDLHCGLLDWGMVRPMNLGTGLWGGLSAAGTGFLLSELDDLLDHYRHVLAAHGGAAVSRADLAAHFDLALAITGLALMMDFPALAEARLPGIGSATGPLDPVITGEKVIQGFLLVSTNFLALWEQRGFAAHLDRL